MRIVSCNTGLRTLLLALSAAGFSSAACNATPPGDARNTTRNGSLLGASDDSPDPGEDSPGGAESPGDLQAADAGSPDPDDPGGAAPDTTPDGGDPNAAGNVNRAGSIVDPGAGDPGLPPEIQSTLDSDGDGFSDAVETSSSDPLYANLAANGANPYLPDIFVYIDYYYAPPNQGALDLVVQAFANAPLTNDFKGRGIALHVIIGKQIPGPEQVQNMTEVCPDDDNVPTDWSAFNTIKVNNFPDEWAKIAHYVLWADQIGGVGGTSGCSNGIPAHDLVVSLGSWGKYKDWDMVQAGTLMHELGHNLGLMHDGQYDLNGAPNYLSVMNYNYQSYGLPLDTGEFVLDYSRIPMGAVSEQGLNEQIAMSDSGLPHAFPYSTGLVNYQAIFGYQWVGKKLDDQMLVRPVKGIVSGWLDFNGNGKEEGQIPPFDLDGNGMTTDVFPATWNDWEHLVYQGAETGGGIIGDGEPETNPFYVVRLSPDEPLHELGHQ